jgi:hypothetical protein
MNEIPAATLAHWDDLIYIAECGGAANAWIGGGAIRDTLLGIPVRDIDVFHEGEISLHYLREHMAWAEARDVDDRYDVPVVSIIDAEDERTAIQFLQCESIPERFKSFAADISKVFYRPGRGVIQTPAFLTAVQTKRITFDEGTSAPYRDKLVEKFQPLGYRFPQLELEF